MEKHRVYLLQPQYGVNLNTYWIPYSVGCIWSYAYQFADIQEDFELADIIFKREHPAMVLDKIHCPSVCAFSTYIWNAQYCIEMAQQIKQRWPECLIVFGGPQVNGTFTKYKFIDTVLMGEGEENFLQVLRRHAQKQQPELFYAKKRLENLSGVPSPYVTGVFDKLITDNPEIVWSMTFETNRGCPYQCTFCDWGSLIYSKVKKFDIDRIRADLEWTVDRPINYLYCADANFGIFKERDLEIATIIREVGDKTNWDTVNLIHAKNSTEVVFQIAKIMGDLNRGVTVSVQSQNKSTLEAIKRKNLASNDIEILMKLSEKYDIPTYTEVILGLPNETMTTWKTGMTEILELGQHNSIDVWFTQLLENSELNSPSSRQQYGIKTVIAKDYMPLYNPNDYRDIAEEFELVIATDTMSTEEMIECYMFSWMIVQFHCTGYSQIMSKHLRSKGTNYHDYYTKLFEMLQTDIFFASHFHKIKNILTNFLTAGGSTETQDNKQGHNLHALSYGFVYENRHEAYRLAIEVADLFRQSDSVVKQLQQNFLYDETKSYPLHIDGYKIIPRLSGSFEFYRNRRQGSFKNKIELLQG